MSDIAVVGVAISVMLVMVMYQLNRITELLKETIEVITRVGDEMESK